MPLRWTVSAPHFSPNCFVSRWRLKQSGKAACSQLARKQILVPAELLTVWWCARCLLLAEISVTSEECESCGSMLLNVVMNKNKPFKVSLPAGALSAYH